MGPYRLGFQQHSRKSASEVINQCLCAHHAQSWANLVVMRNLRDASGDIRRKIAKEGRCLSCRRLFRGKGKAGSLMYKGHSPSRIQRRNFRVRREREGAFDLVG